MELRQIVEGTDRPLAVLGRLGVLRLRVLRFRGVAGRNVIAHR